MALDECEVCECIQAKFGNKEAFMVNVGRVLCAILESGGGAAGDDVEFLFLCDDQGGGTVVQFIRRVITDAGGTPTVADFELDGTTPYVPSGTVEACESTLLDNEALLLLDDQGATSVPFIRQVRLGDGGLVTVVDTELDGTTPYVVAGTVKTAEAAAEALHENILEDDTQIFLRRTQIDSEGNVTITDLELDGVTPYVPGGAISPPTYSVAVTNEVSDQEIVALLDDQGPVSVPFLRSISVDAVGTRTVADFELDGTTPYVVIGTAKAGTVPESLHIVGLYDNTGPTLVEFLRRIEISSEGVVFVTDTELDGTTPYVVAGTPQLKPTHTSDSATVTTTNSSGAGSSSAGNYSTEIRNVGGVAATVDGETFPAGAVVKYEAFVDPVTKQLKTIPAISYDGTGTTLIISEVAP